MSFKAKVNAERKSYVLDSPAHFMNVEVRIGETPRDIIVDFDEERATMTMAEYDDLNVRIRMAREWLVQAQGDVDEMQRLLSTI